MTFGFPTIVSSSFEMISTLNRFSWNASSETCMSFYYLGLKHRKHLEKYFARKTLLCRLRRPYSQIRLKSILFFLFSIFEIAFLQKYLQGLNRQLRCCEIWFILHILRFHIFNENLIGQSCQKFWICLDSLYWNYFFPKLLAVFHHQGVNRQSFSSKHFSNLKNSVSLLSMDFWLLENDNFFMRLVHLELSIHLIPKLLTPFLPSESQQKISSM